MHEDAVNAILLGHSQKSIEMGLIRVHTAIRQKSEKMEAAAARARILHGRKQHRIREKNSPFWIINSMRVLSM